VFNFAMQGPFIVGTNVPNRPEQCATYHEYWLARDCPAVLVIVCKDLIRDTPAHISLVADFMGIVPDEALENRVAAMPTKAFVAQYKSKLNESWVHRRALELGRIPNPNGQRPAARVVVDDHNDCLNAEAVEFLQRHWRSTIAPKTGHNTYQEFAAFSSRRNTARSVAIVAGCSESPPRRRWSLCPSFPFFS